MSSDGLCGKGCKQPMLPVTEQFEHKKAEYEVVKGLCESAVERWEWVDGFLHQPEPFFHERLQFHRGRILHREPSSDHERAIFDQYGFDKNNRLMVIREKQGLINATETFYLIGDTFVDGLLYDANH